MALSHVLQAKTPPPRRSLVYTLPSIPSMLSCVAPPPHSQYLGPWFSVLFFTLSSV